MTKIVYEIWIRNQNNPDWRKMDQTRDSMQSALSLSSIMEKKGFEVDIREVSL
jgi:hypothetical protein